MWGIIGVMLISLFSNFSPRYHQTKKLTYSQFIEKLQNNEIKEVTIDNKLIEGIIRNDDVDDLDETFSTYAPTDLDSYTIEEDWIKEYNVNVKAKPPEQQSMLMHVIISWFPIVFFIGVWIFFMKQMIME